MAIENVGDPQKEAAGVSISVFFPCYNEEANVANTVSKALAVLDKLTSDYEVIIVDDGSADGTGQIADKLAAANPRIKAVHHPKNRGYGGAVQSGIRASTKELIFYTDGDGQFDISEMPPLLGLMEDYDIVACYRMNRQDPLIRKFNAFCWTRLVDFVFDMRIRDVDCAFKLCRRQIFDNMQLCSNGALISAEILARALRKGYRIIQKGVHHYPRTAGVQTGAKLSVIIRAFRELFRLRRQILKDAKNADGNA
jgi:glycosyltransferase involved in cell wall biosynthesis